MSTLLATDRVSSLQWDFRIAVTTQVVDRGAIAGQVGLKGVSARSWDGRGDLICFARHIDDSVMLKDGILCGEEVAVSSLCRGEGKAEKYFGRI